MNDGMAAPLVTSLGWALIHFLWQGALLGLATALALRGLRGARPQTRYALAYGSLLLCVALPAFAVCSGFFATAVPRTGVGLLPSMPAQLPWVVGGWALGSGLLALRMALGLAWVGRARRAGEILVDRRWQERLARTAARIGLRRPVSLRVTFDLESPVAAGLWHPLVLVPAGLLTRMPPDLLEALLAHELAHLKRWDYLANLVQSAVEALLFYHPAVWWISKQIRIEREQIADDLAAAATGEPRRLAVALQELDRFQVSRLRLAQAAHGGHLLSRIQRLVKPQRPVASRKGAFLLLSLAIACLICLALGPVRMVTAPVDSPSDQGSSFEITAPDPRDAPDPADPPAPVSPPDAPDAVDEPDPSSLPAPPS
jgi:Zn-dependent protease with chaperone function